MDKCYEMFKIELKWKFNDVSEQVKFEWEIIAAIFGKLFFENSRRRFVAKKKEQAIPAPFFCNGFLLVNRY